MIAEMNLMDGSARGLAPVLIGSRTSLFCECPIEDSCLWIPAVVRGVRYTGVALRPHEFGRLLLQFLTDCFR